jgi:hypothetical protein
VMHHSHVRNVIKSLMDSMAQLIAKHRRMLCI